MPSRVFFFPAATGVRVPLSKHRQRQALSQPGADGHQARHGPDRVHVLRAVPQHDQVSDFLCQGHPQRAAGVLQEDCRERTTSGNHVDPHRPAQSWDAVSYAQLGQGVVAAVYFLRKSNEVTSV